MSRDILPPAFYRAEAAYLTPPEPECQCEEGEGFCPVHDDEEEAIDWEREQEIRDELREERYERDE